MVVIPKDPSALPQDDSYRHPQRAKRACGDLHKKDTLMNIDFSDFLKVKIATGTIRHAKLNPKARVAAYELDIDFGTTYGTKKSSAQITQNYSIEDLVGKQIVAVMNFEPKRVAGVKSEVLVLAAIDAEKGTVLLEPSLGIQNGSEIA